MYAWGTRTYKLGRMRGGLGCICRVYVCIGDLGCILGGLECIYARVYAWGTRTYIS